MITTDKEEEAIALRLKQLTDDYIVEARKLLGDDLNHIVVLTAGDMIEDYSRCFSNLDPVGMKSLLEIFIDVLEQVNINDMNEAIEQCPHKSRLN